MVSSLKRGHWLGIDIGSGRDKVCSFCLISSDGAGKITVTFEKGPAGNAYPEKNTFKGLIDPQRPPTYLRSEVEDAVGKVLADAQLVNRWLHCTDQPGPTAVAVDAPVALAATGSHKMRYTEAKSTHTFSTPNREDFEHLLVSKQKPGTYTSKVFWKCIGFAAYRWLARHLDPSLPTDFNQEHLAAWTCQPLGGPWRVRETFPSDIYKRANSRDPKTGKASQLGPEAHNVLRQLVASTRWTSAHPKGHVAAVHMGSLEQIRRFLDLDYQAGIERSCEMRKRNNTTGDLWDAFTCAFVVCAEDHDGAEFHGWEEHSEAPERVRQEGAILTVKAAKPT